MPIVHVSAPEGSVNEYMGWLTKRKPGMLLFANQQTLAHKTFHVKLSDIVSGEGFSNAYLVSWRHLYTDTHGSTAVEIKVNEQGKHQFHEAHSGPMVDEMKALYPKLMKKKELQHEDYEHAFLRLFALKICAIWLRAADRKNDYFIPLPPYFYGLKPGKLYTAEDFIKVTQNAIGKLNEKSKGHPQPMKGG